MWLHTLKMTNKMGNPAGAVTHLVLLPADQLSCDAGVGVLQELHQLRPLGWPSSCCKVLVDKLQCKQRARVRAFFFLSFCLVVLQSDTAG